MKVYGRVIDNIQKAAIEGAAVSMVDETGATVAGPLTTDHAGNFSFNDPDITLQSSIVIAHPFYYPKELPLSGSASQGLIYVDPLPVVQSRPADLAEFVEEEPVPAPGKNYSWLLLLLAAVLLWPKSKSRAKK